MGSRHSCRERESDMLSLEVQLICGILWGSRNVCRSAWLLHCNRNSELVPVLSTEPAATPRSISARSVQVKDRRHVHRLPTRLTLSFSSDDTTTTAASRMTVNSECGFSSPRYDPFLSLPPSSPPSHPPPPSRPLSSFLASRSGLFIATRFLTCR